MTAKETRTRTTEERASQEHTRKSETAQGAAGRMPGATLFDQAMESYEQALKSGLRLQEESAKWWAGMLNEASSPGSWYRAANFFTEETAAAQKRLLDDLQQLLEQNSRRSLELLKRAGDASTTLSPAELQRKLQELWEDSLQLLRSNATGVAQANRRALDAWMEQLRRNAEMATNGGMREEC